ncbi:MAG: hypothetical protein IKC46_10620 [Lachnospiraceae bacterium]|nr:hypothetical protein [Lachnospiraceae bacterium]
MTRKENYIRALYNRNPQWVPYVDEAVITVLPPVCERPGLAGKDAFGCEWLLEEEAEGGTYPANYNYVITDLQKWRTQLKLPDINAYDWSEARKNAAEIDREQYLVGGFIEMGIFERIWLLIGMEEALMAFCTDDDKLCELAHAIADYKIEFLKKYHAEVGLDILWYGDDWGTQDNLFISPEKWRTVIKPATQRIYDCAKTLGILVNQHSCGKVESIFGDIIEMGAVSWNPCQPCNNLAGLKKKYGSQICFIGGVDSQFVLGNHSATVADVITEVKRRIDEMSLPDGGYIIGPSHGVPYDPAKLKAMHDTIREYGKEIYNKS